MKQGGKRAVQKASDISFNFGSSDVFVSVRERQSRILGWIQAQRQSYLSVTQNVIVAFSGWSLSVSLSH